jgi:uncharacterized protein YuzE
MCLGRKETDLAQVKVYYDRKGETLIVWFGNASDEYICEETGEDIILIKDKDGQVIGFEQAHFSLPHQEELQVAS